MIAHAAEATRDPPDGPGAIAYWRAGALEVALEALVLARVSPAR